MDGFNVETKDKFHVIEIFLNLCDFLNIFKRFYKKNSNFSTNSNQAWTQVANYSIKNDYRPITFSNNLYC